MKRHFVPGTVDRFGVARATTCCDGTCSQGRTCPLVPRRCPEVMRMPAPRIQVTGGKVPRMRRLKRFWRALKDHWLGGVW